MDTIPNNVIRDNILIYLSSHEILIIRTMNKHLKHICDDEYLWKQRVLNEFLSEHVTQNCLMNGSYIKNNSNIKLADKSWMHYYFGFKLTINVTVFIRHGCDLYLAVKSIIIPKLIINRNHNIRTIRNLIRKMDTMDNYKDYLIDHIIDYSNSITLRRPKFTIDKLLSIDENNYPINEIKYFASLFGLDTSKIPRDILIQNIIDNYNETVI